MMMAKNDNAPTPFTVPGPDVPLAHVAFRAAAYTPANKPVTYVRSEAPHFRRGVRAYLSADGAWVVLVDASGDHPNRHVPREMVAGVVFGAEVARHASAKRASAHAPDLATA